MKRKTVITILAVILSASILNGCASSDAMKKQISEMQEEVDKQANELQAKINEKTDQQSSEEKETTVDKTDKTSEQKPGTKPKQEPDPKEKKESETKQEPETESKQEQEKKSSDNEKPKAVEDKPTEDVADNDKAESDKFPKTINDDIDVAFSESVPEDVTGKWRLARVATEKEIQVYALEYSKSYFQSDDEIHAIVNSSLGTTNKLIKISSDVLDITVYEYVDQEENDAKILFTGTLLANYQINISTGEVTQIPSDEEENNTINGDASDTSNTDSPENPSETTAAPEPVEPAPDMVWIDDTGKKYHSNSYCSNMSDPYQVTRPEAESMGRDACKKCY